MDCIEIGKKRLQAAKSADELRRGLVATCQEDVHWCCHDDFLALCDLSRLQLEGQLKKWWGQPELWLDMLATQIARGVGARVGLELDLGTTWVKAADEWVDAAYVRATVDMSCPPPRPMLFTKAAQFVQRILGSLRGLEPCAPKILCLNRAEGVVCKLCGVDYSKRLGNCPTCFPLSVADTSDSPEARREARRATWQKLPRAPIAGVDWSGVTEVMWCHGGSGGALLVKLRDGVVCAKMCSANELFAQRLSSALGTRTAHMRVLTPTGEESIALRRAIQRVAQNDDRLRRRAGESRLSVIEFVDGFVMMGLPAHAYLRQSEGSAPPWYELGRLMAFDMLINNFDRLPLAWTNDGNLGNVMLGSSLGVAVGIDQSVAPIVHVDGLRAYTSRVRQAVVEARDGEAKAFAAVKDAIYNNTATELTAAELRILRQGCFDFVLEVVRLADQGHLEGILEGVSSEVSAAFGRETTGDNRQATRSPRPLSDMLKSYCDLILEVIHIFREVAA